MNGGSIHGWFDGAVCLDDVNGRVGLIPTHKLKSMVRHASERDAGSANCNGRKYDRDLLMGAWDQYLNHGLPELDDCDISGCDRPGTEPLGNGVTFCAECCSAATPFDDKD